MNNFYESDDYRYYNKLKNLGNVLFYYLSGNSLIPDNNLLVTTCVSKLDDSQREMLISLGNILFNYFSGRKLSENELSLIAIMSNNEKMCAMIEAMRYNVKISKKDFLDSCLFDVVHLSNEEILNIINSPCDNDKRISAMQISSECNLKRKTRNYKILCQNAASISAMLANDVKSRSK